MLCSQVYYKGTAQVISIPSLLLHNPSIEYPYKESEDTCPRFFTQLLDLLLLLSNFYNR